MKAETIISIIGENIKSIRVQYVANHGNAGDAIIAQATAGIVERLGLILDDDANTVLVGGGGNLVPFQHCGSLMEKINKIPADKSVVMLPCSLDGSYPAELKKVSQFHPSFTVLCREEVTFRLAVNAGLNAVRCSDVAFTLDLPKFSIPIGGNHLTAFRGDSESADRVRLGTLNRLGKNQDLSLMFEQRWWTLDEKTEEVAMAFVSFLLKFASVDTDRLHVAIISARLGLYVRFWPNGYHKNEGVFVASLTEFPNVRFMTPFA